jgi:ribosome-binding protein aMBF1 (putative translation factor)
MTRRGRSNKGSGRPAAKLTEDAVAEIRKAYAAGGISQTALAVRYGVHQSNICRALKGDLWSHVPVEEVKNF